MFSIDLTKYLPAIRTLKPLSDSRFLYEINRWSKLDPKYKELISDFENKEISRFNVIESYKDYYENNGSIKKAFLLTMVWGFANTGYGWHRTNKYLSTSENLELIEKAISALRENNLKSAFSNLKRIKWLGVSYITKVLYFASIALNQKKYPLIYDIRVTSALVKLTSPKEVHEIISVGPSSKFSDYEKYNTLIHSVAYNHRVEAESIEMFLFNQKF